MGPLVYLDVCCFKRPFDDQRQERVRLESAAVAAIIARAERGEARLVRSPAHDLENGRNPREDRRLAAAAWLNGASVEVQLSDRVAARARLLGTLGFQPLDALHAAFAEEAGATWLATADDRMLTLAHRHAPSLRVAVANPRVVAGQLIEEGQ
jgi:predicted nucleic acid-binding protein